MHPAIEAAATLRLNENQSKLHTTYQNSDCEATYSMPTTLLQQQLKLLLILKKITQGVEDDVDAHTKYQVICEAACACAVNNERRYAYRSHFPLLGNACEH